MLYTGWPTKSLLQPLNPVPLWQLRLPRTTCSWIPVKLCDPGLKTTTVRPFGPWAVFCHSLFQRICLEGGKPGGRLWFFCYPIFATCSHRSLLFPGVLLPVLPLSAFLFKMRVFRSIQPSQRTGTGELAFCEEGDGLEDGGLEEDTSHGLELGPVLSYNCQTPFPGSTMWVKPWPGSHQALDGMLSFGWDILSVLRYSGEISCQTWQLQKPGNNELSLPCELSHVSYFP